jgi:ABC-type sugar transport system ATPase subunit
MGVSAAVAATAAVVSSVATMQAQKAQNQAQEKAAKIQQRQAALETQRRARRAVAERRILQAEMQQSAFAQNQGGNSALSGAVGSLQTQTAANIGAARTNLAGEIGMNRALISGARSAARWNTVAGVASAVSSVASTPQFGQWTGAMKGTSTATQATAEQQRLHAFRSGWQ